MTHRTHAGGTDDIAAVKQLICFLPDNGGVSWHYLRRTMKLDGWMRQVVLLEADDEVRRMDAAGCTALQCGSRLWI